MIVHISSLRRIQLPVSVFVVTRRYYCGRNANRVVAAVASVSTAVGMSKVLVQEGDVIKQDCMAIKLSIYAPGDCVCTSVGAHICRSLSNAQVNGVAVVHNSLVEVLRFLVRLQIMCCTCKVFCTQNEAELKESLPISRALLSVKRYSGFNIELPNCSRTMPQHAKQ